MFKKKNKEVYIPNYFNIMIDYMTDYICQNSDSLYYVSLPKVAQKYINALKHCTDKIDDVLKARYIFEQILSEEDKKKWKTIIGLLTINI